MKSGQLNVSTNPLSRIETGEEPTSIEDGLPDAQLFKIDMMDDYYEQIIQFLSIGKAPNDFTTSQKKQLVIRAAYFQLIAGQLYKMGPNEILRRYVLPHEQGRTLIKAHEVVAGGHYAGRATTKKILWAGL